MLKRSIYNAAEMSFAAGLDDIAAKTAITDHHPDAGAGPWRSGRSGRRASTPGWSRTVGGRRQPSGPIPPAPGRRSRHAHRSGVPSDRARRRPCRRAPHSHRRRGPRLRPPARLRPRRRRRSTTTANPAGGPYTEDHPFHDPFVLFALPRRHHRADRAGHRRADPAAAPDRARRQAGRRRRPAVGWPAAPRRRHRLELRRVRRPRPGLRAPRGAGRTSRSAACAGSGPSRVVDFEGTFDRIDRAASTPARPRPIPIWVGGFSERGVPPGRRLGDGFIFAGRPDDA